MKTEAKPTYTASFRTRIDDEDPKGNPMMILNKVTVTFDTLIEAYAFIIDNKNDATVYDDASYDIRSSANMHKPIAWGYKPTGYSAWADFSSNEGTM